ncbi:MAG: protein translocase subunit SecDF [Saprospiraceae bacterium]
MQGKGIVKVFLVLIIAVCLLQFAYFIPTRNVESAADDYATKMTGKSSDAPSADFKLARANYLDSVSGLELFKIPMVKSYTYSELKKQQLALGLDLKGGMSTVLQVDLSDFLKSLAGRSSNNADFQKALDNANIAMRSSQSDYITLFADEYRKIAGDNKLARIFARSETLGEVNANTDDGTVTRLIRAKADETVNLTYERLKQRIDKLGVAQPNVSLDPNRDLILVEMPGIDNPQRARQFLQASAKLEFWDTYRYSDPGINSSIQSADQLLSGKAIKDSLNVEMDTIKVAQMDELGKLLPDSITQVVPRSSQGSASSSLLSVLNLNGGTMYQSVIGMADKGQRANITKMLEREDVKALFPKNAKFMWSYKPVQDESGNLTNNYELYLIKKLSGSDLPPLDGDVVTSAQQTLNAVSGEVEVNLRMNAVGAKKWAEMTTKAANDGNREIAIALDDEVVSAPRVNDAITQGSSSISGNFSVEEAVDFASILEVGKLPARTKIIQESNVGPSLGKTNISKSVNSLLIGFSLVIITMLAYYFGAGLIAIISLLLNVFLIFGTLSSFGTVLTLSGIAGIVLTIGMAVDANVIIFERIKEELSSGKTLKQSISDGFHHSYSAIIDANVTTILTAMILAYFGLGPVKGFAIVLIIGVMSSVFTAIFISRLMIDWWVGKGNDLSFWTNFSKGAFKNINIDWIGKRKIAYVFSGLLITAGLISILTRGFDLGVDYKGGFSYNVQFTGSESMNSDKLRDGLTAVFGAPPVVKQVDSDNTFNITTSYLITEAADDTPSRVLGKLHEGVAKIASSDVALADFSNYEAADDVIHITSSAQVGPTIADDLKRSSLYAGIFALLVVFLYILIRFSKWQYSAGAIIAVFHDAFIVLSIFSLGAGLFPFSLEIDQAFIAAILTVIGYSLNDTVIIFDRIREFFGIHVNKGKDDIINDAINSTLSRTLMTSFTTVVVILILFLFGGDSIKGFSFALLVGIVVGTYSSVFIAAPILHDLATDLKITRKSSSPSSKKSDDKKSFSRAGK